MQIAFDKEVISQAFKSMNADEKKALNQAFGKLQSFYSSHEVSKCDETAQMILDIMNEKSWNYNPRVNHLLGLIQLVGGNFYAASESFFYANNIRYAYCAAFQGAEMCDDKRLYELAAAFAVIALTCQTAVNSAEAIEVLRESSVMASDISGIEYTRKHGKDNVTAAMDDIIKAVAENYITNKKEVPDTNTLLVKARAHLSNTDVQAIITEYLDKLPSTKDQGNAPVPDKEHNGSIASYKFYEYNGTIRTADGEQYVFDIKDVTDVSLKNQLQKVTTTKDFKPIAVKFMLTKRAGKYVAVSVKRRETQIAPPPTPVDTDTNHNVIGDSCSADASRQARYSLGLLPSSRRKDSA